MAAGRTKGGGGGEESTSISAVPRAGDRENQPATAQSCASLSYAPKTATATRHKMPVVVPLVTILLRLLHGFVIVLLFVARDDGLGRDRGRLFAARVHSAATMNYTERIGDSCVIAPPAHTPIYRYHYYRALPAATLVLSRKNAPQTNYYYFTRCEL